MWEAAQSTCACTRATLYTNLQVKCQMTIKSGSDEQKSGTSDEIKSGTSERLTGWTPMAVEFHSSHEGAPFKAEVFHWGHWLGHVFISNHSYWFYSSFSHLTSVISVRPNPPTLPHILVRNWHWRSNLVHYHHNGPSGRYTTPSSITGTSLPQSSLFANCS